MAPALLWCEAAATGGRIQLGEGDGGREIGRGAADDDCEVILVGVVVLSVVAEPVDDVWESVGVSVGVGGSVGADVVESVAVGVDMERMDPGRETPDGVVGG